MGKTYDQLDIDERCEIYRLREAGGGSRPPHQERTLSADETA